MAFYVFPNAISKKECKRLLKHCLKNFKFDDATILGEKGIDSGTLLKNKVTDHDVRKTSVSFITDKNDIMNEIVWGFIRQANTEFFKYNMDYFQPIQFAKYQNGGHYVWHQDATFFPDQKECRKLSLTFSLTDHTTYEGGLLQFYNGDKPYEDKDHDVEKDIKSVGTVIVFDSRDWHRVTPVTKGVRYSIVCWAVGPNFV